MDIGSILKWLFIGLDIAIVMIFIIYILRGFLNGWFKTTLNMGINIVCILVSFLISLAVSKLVLNMKIPFLDNSSLQSFLNTFIAKVFFEGDIQQWKDTGMDVVLSDFIASFIKTIVLCISMIVTLVIVGGIAKLITSIIIKKKRDKKLPLWSRFVGIGIAVVNFVFVFYFVWLPVYGLGEIAQKTSYEISQLKDVEYAEAAIKADSISDGISSSFILKTTSSIKSKNSYFGAPAKRLANTVKVKTDNGTIDFISDAEVIIPKIGRFVEISLGIKNTEDPNEKLDIIKKDDVKLLTDVLKDNSIIKAMYPTLINFIQNNKKCTDALAKFDFDYEILKNADPNKDFSNSTEFLEAVYDLLQMIDLNNIKDASTILANEEIPDQISLCLSSVMNITIFGECFPKVSCYYLSEALKDTDYGFVCEVITVRYIKEDLSKDVGSIFYIYNKSNKIKLFEQFSEGSVTLDLTDKATNETVEQIIEKLLNLELIEGNEELLFNKFFEISQLSDYIGEITISEDVNWETEKAVMKNILIDVIDLGVDSLKLKEEETQLESVEFLAVKLGKLLDDMSLSSITGSKVFNILDKVIESLNCDFSLTEEEKNLIKESTFSNEFAVLFDVIKDAKDFFGEEAIEGNFSNINGTDVTNLMLKASTSVLASKVIGHLLDMLLGPEQLNVNPIDPVTNLPKYDFSTKEAIAENAAIIGNLIDLANAVASAKDEINSETISALVDSITSLSGENELIEDILSETIGSTGLEFSGDINWQEEATLVESILEDYESLENKEDFDLDSYDFGDSQLAKDILDYLCNN